MPKTLFSPAQHGFRFANYFENVIFEESPFGRIATRGRCGGMAFAALDHYYAGLALPNVTQRQLAPALVPPDSAPLSSYIYRRQIDSFLMLSAVKYLTYSLAPDAAGFLVKGVRRWTREDEFPKLRASIDTGKPAPLGLIAARDLRGLGQNHQVIAYGYDLAANGVITLDIYDVNYANRALTLRSDPARGDWLEDSETQESWRGWFVEDYAPQLPPAGLDNWPDRPAITPGRNAETAPRRKIRTNTLNVVLKTVTFHNLEEPEMAAEVVLDFNIEGQRWSWPQRGTRRVKHGARIKLNKRFEVSVPKDGALNVNAKLSPGVTTTDTPGFDAFEFFNLDNDRRAGTLALVYTANETWGRGEHEERSSGAQGGYVLTFEIT